MISVAEGRRLATRAWNPWGHRPWGASRRGSRILSDRQGVGGRKSGGELPPFCPWSPDTASQPSQKAHRMMPRVILPLAVLVGFLVLEVSVAAQLSLPKGHASSDKTDKGKRPRTSPRGKLVPHLVCSLCYERNYSTAIAGKGRKRPC